MPNRYSHAFVLSDYEKRGVFESIYQRDTSRYHQPAHHHHHQSSTSSFSPSSTRSSLSYTIQTSETNAVTPSPPRTTPPRPASSVFTHAEQHYPPQLNSRPTPASPSLHTPSSVVTQIYKPGSPRSYFDSDSSQPSHVTATRPLSPTTDLYTPLSPLPATLDYLDLESSPGSEKTTPRSSLDGLTLAEILLESVPPPAIHRPTHLPYDGMDAFDDGTDEAVPPPISRQRRDTHSPRSRRPSTPLPRPGSRQNGSFAAQVWSPPRSPKAANNTSARNVSPPIFSPPKPPPPPPAATPPRQPRSTSQTHTPKLQKGNHSRPTPPPLQRARTDLNAEEMQRWKKEVQQAKWRKGSWVGALVGFKGLGGRREGRD